VRDDAGREHQIRSGSLFLDDDLNPHLRRFSREPIAAGKADSTASHYLVSGGLDESLLGIEASSEYGAVRTNFCASIGSVLPATPRPWQPYDLVSHRSTTAR
jgi:hypothetical protein